MATGSDTRELAGYRALVTGGTQGIGAAVSARLREAGATVLTIARKRPDALASDCLFVAADVATAEGCALSRAPWWSSSVASISSSMSSADHRLPEAASQCSTRVSGIAR